MRLIKVFNRKVLLGLVALIFTSCIPGTLDYCCVRENNARFDLDRIYSNINCIPGNLKLDDIVQIALARNLDVQLQYIEQCVQSKTYVAETLKMLPELNLNGEYSHRDNVPAWFSRPVGEPLDKTIPATQSTDKNIKRFDATLAFSIIDFGLSYVRSRQEKNRACLLQQRHLRARQNLVLDVFRAYYRAMTAKQALEKSKTLITKLEERQQTLKKQMREQIVSEMKGLLNENRLIDMQVRLHAFENEYRSAITELSGLMGLPPCCTFCLADIEPEEVYMSPINPCCLDSVALVYRPELMAQDIQYYIDADEVKAEMLKIFPNARLFGGGWYDDDRFIFNKHWVNVGATVAWDLFSIPAKVASANAYRGQQQVARFTRLSISMGIMTQVHLAHINVEDSDKQYKLALELFRIKNRQLQVAKLLEDKGQLDADDVISFEVEALFSQVNAFKSYGNLQVALEQLGNAIGRPLYFTGWCYNRDMLGGVENCCCFACNYNFPVSIIRKPLCLDLGRGSCGSKQVYYEDYLDELELQMDDNEDIPLQVEEDDELTDYLRWKTEKDGASRRIEKRHLDQFVKLKEILQTREKEEKLSGSSGGLITIQLEN